MYVWEADFYRRPLQDQLGNPLWELLVCAAAGEFRYAATCTQSEASANWVAAQLTQVLAKGDRPPDQVHVFRPQSLSLLETACHGLGIPVIPTRKTYFLKRWLEERFSQYPQAANFTGQADQSLNLDRPPPLPLATNLLGEQWRFAALPAAALVEAFAGRMIPILDMPESLLPLNLGLASTVAIPGVVIDGGRQSMHLAQWIQTTHPVALQYISGAPDGLILEAGLVDRWVMATFEDQDVAKAAREFEARKQRSQGLHFLLVQPDDSGMTYTGFWLLRLEA